MAFSGTTGLTITSVQDFIDESVRRAGKLPGELTGEQLLAAKRNLFMLLSHLGNKGINYWTITTQVYGFSTGQFIYTMPVGFVDTLEVLYRQTNRPTGAYTSSTGTAANAFDSNINSVCLQSAPNGWIEADFSGTSGVEAIITIGFLPYLPSSPSTWNYQFQYSLDNVNWVSVLTQTSQAVSDNTWVWTDIINTVNAPYWRMLATGGTTLSVRELYFGDATTEVPMSRLNRSDYANLPNKGFEADQPFQYYVERDLSPDIKLWPVPSNTFKQMVVWYRSETQDIGALSNQLGIPTRWSEAIQALHAHKTSMMMPGVDPARIQMLKGEATQMEIEARMEERDKSKITLAPNIGVYTK